MTTPSPRPSVDELAFAGVHARAISIPSSLTCALTRLAQRIARVGPSKVAENPIACSVKRVSDPDQRQADPPITSDRVAITAHVIPCPILTGEQPTIGAGST
jgi:hypothetical protein